MTEQELYNEYRKSDCKSFTDFLINKITNLKTDYEVLSCSVGDFDELQNRLEEEQRKNNGLSDNLTKAKEIISEWEDSFCCGADYLYLGNKGKELRIKSQKFLNSEVNK